MSDARDEFDGDDIINGEQNRSYLTSACWKFAAQFEFASCAKMRRSASELCTLSLKIKLPKEKWLRVPFLWIFVCNGLIAVLICHPFFKYLNPVNY